MNLSFRNRIALHYMLASAIIMAVTFGVIYAVVQETVYQNLDSDLAYEAHKHTSEITVTNDNIKISNKKEWEEREHREVQVNPVFIQILDKKGNFVDKSPNLKEKQLLLRQGTQYEGHFNETLNSIPIRQVQVPIEVDGEIKGFIIAAMSFESSKMVLLNLRNVLWVSYLLLLAVLYLFSRYLAGRSIAPISRITDTTNRITKNNLNERVHLPVNRDELYDLSASINELLQRIENALERERQFTSDASHELRTPLASLRGTLEVLIRKPRERKEYEVKIKDGLYEIDRMTGIIEQLLLLARMEATNPSQTQIKTSLPSLVDDILTRYSSEITRKNLTIAFTSDHVSEMMVPQYYANLILDNIINNAIKYSNPEGKIYIDITKAGSKVSCKIKDEGIGFAHEELGSIFNHFYRSETVRHQHIPGNGLGLSIAKKAADAIHAKIEAESAAGKGTVFTILF